LLVIALKEGFALAGQRDHLQDPHQATDEVLLEPGHQRLLRGLADEFGESTNSVRVELNRLSEAGLLESADEGRTKVYRANTTHPLFPEVQRIVAKTVGLDRLVEQVVSRLGNVELAFITGDTAKGIDSGLIDLVLVGRSTRAIYRTSWKKLEALIERKVRTLVLSVSEYEKLLENFSRAPALVLWKQNGAAHS
jgi:hypothetical protein